MLLQKQNGEPITLGAEIGKGGEGRVNLVEGFPSLVAKVYHRITNERIHKLSAMLTTPPDDPMAGKQHISIAWPVSLLATTGDHPEWVGYLMPRVDGMHPVFEFYNPSIRRQRCPFFNYGYLNQTALNLSAAVHALHTRGYVIGDVNESNIFVSDSALVTLVDTDSFQVNDRQNGVVYRCPVGKLEFTPPELQGRKFADVDRAPESDLFGLGVLIYQLLMEGAHPFAGKYLGQGDPPSVEQRISSGHFPHGPTGAHYAPTPSGLPFNTLNPNLQQLFLQCFVEGHRNPKVRPDAQTWHYALQGATDALKKCSANAHHRYNGHLSTCPWCERCKKLGGRDAFPSEDAVRNGSHLRPSARKPSATRSTPGSSHSGRPSSTASSPKVAQAPTSTNRIVQWWSRICRTIATWWPPARQAIIARPYISAASFAVAVLFVVLVANATHRGTVSDAYLTAMTVAENQSDPEAGIAALQSVLSKYSNAVQAPGARSRIDAIVESIFVAAYKNADAEKKPEAAIKILETVMSKYPNFEKIETVKFRIAQIKAAKKAQSDALEVTKKKQDAAIEVDMAAAKTLMANESFVQAESRLKRTLRDNPCASAVPDAIALLKEVRRMLDLQGKASALQPRVRRDFEWLLSQRSESHPAKSLLSSFDSFERENWKKAADGGCPEAQLLMGWCYDLCVGVDADRDTAADYFRKAAEQGNAWAQFKLWRCFYGASLQSKTLSMQAREAWLRKAAEQGLGDAQEALGLCYYDGKQIIMGSDIIVCSIDKNRAEAARWFRKAAVQGYPAAQCWLGYMCMDGDGVKKDIGETVAWFRKAAEQGNSAAQNNLGVMYSTGSGIQRDAREALQWIAKASENETSRNVADSAMWTIARNLSLLNRGGGAASGLGLVVPDIKECHRRREVWSFRGKIEDPVFRDCRQDPAEQSPVSSASAPTAEEYRKRAKDTKPAQMVEYVKHCAELGVPEAQTDFAVMYAMGTGVSKNETEAVTWVRKAAEQGYAKGQSMFGYFLSVGMGVPKDERSAVEWYRKAADQGFATAQTALGSLYYNGIGVEKDWTEAARWFRKGAETGDSEGEYNLAIAYAFGKGIEKDTAEAVKWFQKAASAGNASAALNLGLIFGSGEDGRPKDENKACFWFRKAAEQGIPQAQRNLGICYAYGRGVPQDFSNAAFWFRKAAEQGDADAQFNLGVNYDSGQGVTQDESEAIKWYRLAAKQGQVPAKQRLAELGQ